MKVFICLLLIGLLYFGCSVGNRTWNMFGWNTDCIAFFIMFSIFIILTPIYISFVSEDYRKLK